MLQFLLLLWQDVGVVRYISRGEGPNGVQIQRLKGNEITRVEDRKHLLTHRGWDVNLKGVLSDLRFDL